MAGHAEHRAAGGEGGDDVEVTGHHKIENHFHGEDHEEGEPWLLSYADMVTLLMCFFILFFSIDKTKGGINNPERLQKRLERALSLDETVAATLQSETLKKIQDSLSSDLYKISRELKIVFALSHPDPETVSLTFLSNNFFPPGDATLSKEAQQALTKVAARILEVAKGSSLTIEVDGHTDSDPLRNNPRYPSNWELSAARAASVARFLIAQGIPPSIVQVSGFADQRPVIPSDTAGISGVTAKRMNRRVEIRLKAKGKDPAKSAAPPAANTHGSTN